LTESNFVDATKNVIIMSNCQPTKAPTTAATKKKVKSFLSLTAHRAALISVPLALSQTPAYTAKTTDTGLVHRAVCPFTPRLLLLPFNGHLCGILPSTCSGRESL